MRVVHCQKCSHRMERDKAAKYHTVITCPNCGQSARVAKSSNKTWVDWHRADLIMSKE